MSHLPMTSHFQTIPVLIFQSFYCCFFFFISDVYRKSLLRLASFKIKRHDIFIIFYYFGSSAVSLSSATFITRAATHKSQVIWAMLSLR
jgi:hypothetical protein